MTPAETNAPSAAAPPLDRFSEIEMERVFDAILAINNVRMQQFALFSTLNVAVVSVALTTQRGGLLLVGSLVWLLGLAGDQIQREIAVRFFYRAYVLQRRFAPGEPYTYLTAYFQDTLAPFMGDIDAGQPAPELARQLRRLTRRRALVAGSFLVLAIGLLELGLGLFVILAGGWKVF